MGDLFFGTYLCTILHVKLDVVCQALNVEKLIEADPGSLPLGSYSKVSLIEHALFLLQIPNSPLVHKIVLDKQDKGFEKDNEVKNPRQSIHIGYQRTSSVNPEFNDDEHGDNAGQQFQAKRDHQHIERIDGKLSEFTGKQESGNQEVVEEIGGSHNYWKQKRYEIIGLVIAAKPGGKYQSKDAVNQNPENYVLIGFHFYFQPKYRKKCSA